MKPKFTRLALAASLPLVFATYTQAQSTWTGATGGEWGTASNWSGGVPNATSAVANIPTALTVNLSDTGTGGTYPYTFGTLAASIPSGSVVIGNNGLTTDILTAASLGVPVINVANNNTNIFFYANLEGTQGFEKTGAGKLTFRFNSAAQTYSGLITITGGILGITNNGSLGNANNSISIASGARLLLEPSPNATVTLGTTRTITLSGVQSQIGASNAADHLIIDGSVNESIAGNGLVKTDAGKVTLNGTLSYTGETRIAGGTLALSGSAALPTGQNLRFNQATGTLDVGSTMQTVRTIVMDNTAGNKTITGADGSLTVNGVANLQLSANNAVTYDFSGLGSFTYNRSANNFSFQPVNVASVTTVADLNLAKSGVAGGTNTITAALIQLGGGASLGNNGNTARLHLGTTNTFNTTTFNVGGYEAGGIVDFQASLTSPSLKIRGIDGSSAIATMTVGATSSGSRRGEGVLNLTGGSLDALVTNLTIGSYIASATISDTSSLTMPAGTLIADTIKLAEKVNNGTPTLTSTFTQVGGEVTANTIIFGIGGGEAARLLPTYNLWGGTLTASTVQAGGGTFAANSSRNLILRDGTLINQTGADLTINGVTIVVAGNTTTIVDSTASQKVVVGSTATYSARLNSFAGTSGALTVNGDLDLTASPAFNVFDDAPAVATLLAPGTKLVLINYSGGSLMGQFAGLAEGATVSVTKGAVTNDFVISYADSNRVTLTIPSGVNNYASWANDPTKGNIPGELAAGDFDNDGLTNIVEYALGKNPRVSSTPAGVLLGNTITYTKGSDAIANADVSWTIETSTTLASGSWTPEPSATQLAGDPALTIAFTFTPSTPPKNFARLKVLQAP